VSVRRHYLQAFEERLAALFVPVRGGRGYRGGHDGVRRAGPRGTPRTLVSDSLRRALKGNGPQGIQVSPREAVIVMSLVNHPALAHNRLEMLADIELPSTPARTLMTALLDLVTVHPDLGADGLRQALAARGFGETLARMGAILKAQGIWQADEGSAESDAETGLKHALALHYKSVQLNRERKAAEKALGEAPSESSFERLRDILNQISSVDGTEALIEGFGSLSGRATRSL